MQLHVPGLVTCATDWYQDLATLRRVLMELTPSRPIAIAVPMHDPPGSRYPAEDLGRTQGVRGRLAVGRSDDPLDGHQVGEIAAGPGPR
jgi:hypothetical protein